MSVEFSRLTSVIRDGIDRRLHTGVQVYISQKSQTLLDAAFGSAREGVPLTPRTSMLWRSAGKPITAFLVMKRIEDGRARLDSPLRDVLPSSLSSDKADCTLFQLLTHTAGFPDLDTGWPFAEWPASVDTILRTPLRLTPGTAAYHPLSSWFLLGDFLLQTSARSTTFSALLQDELFHPLGMESSAACCPPADHIQPPVGSADCATMYVRNGGQLMESEYNREPWTTRVAPGGTLRGPVRDLGVFYEMLMNEGRSAGGKSLADAETVSQMTTRSRAGLYDLTFQHIVDFGLGLILDSNQYGPDTVPYGFGKYCSPLSFGHGGSQCSMGFCDPSHRLVVTWAANGFCGEGQHQRRNRAINEAVYQDLGIA
jgi:CubicO group peptidase (beta-lactamase class C family)